MHPSSVLDEPTVLPPKKKEVLDKKRHMEDGSVPAKTSDMATGTVVEEKNETPLKKRIKFSALDVAVPTENNVQDNLERLESSGRDIDGVVTDVEKTNIADPSKGPRMKNAADSDNSGSKSIGHSKPVRLRNSEVDLGPVEVLPKKLMKKTHQDNGDGQLGGVPPDASAMKDSSVSADQCIGKGDGTRLTTGGASSSGRGSKIPAPGLGHKRAHGPSTRRYLSQEQRGLLADFLQLVTLTPDEAISASTAYDHPKMVGVMREVLACNVHDVLPYLGVSFTDSVCMLSSSALISVDEVVAGVRTTCSLALAEVDTGLYQKYRRSKLQSLVGGYTLAVLNGMKALLGVETLKGLNGPMEEYQAVERRSKVVKTAGDDEAGGSGKQADKAPVEKARRSGGRSPTPPTRSGSAPGKEEQNAASRDQARAIQDEDSDDSFGGAVDRPLPLSIRENREPYYQGDWRKEPYEPRAYKMLSSYVLPSKIKDERETLKWKMASRDGRDNISKDFFRHHQKLGEEQCKAAANQLIDQVKERKTLKMGEDVVERDCWGMDCYTRKNVFDAIQESGAFRHLKSPHNQKSPSPTPGNGSSAAENSADAVPNPSNGPVVPPTLSVHSGPPIHDPEGHAVNDWIDFCMMVKVNRMGAKGWNMGAALTEIVQEARASGDTTSLKAADAVLNRYYQVGRNYFRLHPKGRGMFCDRAEGIPAFTFVEEYFGEVHTGWRWFEMQDMIKKLTKEELPDFYNMTLERFQEDKDGYDVIFIDAAFAGSFASRMSHSCTPNCQAVNMSCGGRLTVALYTLRDIRVGEELTFDYSSVTESEKEFKAAICLCGTRHCRGSYLYYAGSTAFTQIMETQHNFLHRQVMMLRGSTEKYTEADEELLHQYGLKDSALGNDVVGNKKLPTWARKWAALALQFVELERSLLPQTLVGQPGTLHRYDLETATAESYGVANNRVTNITITLDKVKHLLAQQDKYTGPPLKMLSSTEVKDHLWNGMDSIACQVVRQVCLLAVNGLSKELAAIKSRDVLMSFLQHKAKLCPDLGHLRDLVSPLVSTPAEASKKLLELESFLRDLQHKNSHLHYCCADVLHLYGRTKIWFTLQSYKGFTSQPVELHADLMKMHKIMVTGNLPGDLVVLHSEDTDLHPSTSGGVEGDRNNGETKKRMMRQNSGVKGSDSIILCKKYTASFIWGQLSGWFKQTVYDPSASLSAERRGTLSLPDIESCYTNAADYIKKERAAILNMIQKCPDRYWQQKMFKFKNKNRCYGSPMFDAFWFLTVEGTPISDTLDPILKHLREKGPQERS